MSATAAAVAFVVFSCKGKLGEAEAIKLSETPVQTVRDMFIVQSENGMIQMRAVADLMEKYERDTLTYELFPEGFSVYGYTDAGLLETEIVAASLSTLTISPSLPANVPLIIETASPT